MEFKKILFLTTHNLAANPRLYKEIMLAMKCGYQVEIICFEFDNWSKEINEELKQQLGALKIISIPAGRTPVLPWFWSVITETFFRKLGKFISLPVPALAQAVSRRNKLLIKAFNKVAIPDWVIGHNPGALWPAVKAARKFNCKVGFDVEDYHPGEGNNKYLQSISRKLMVELLPKIDYVSFASPLILQQVKTDIDIAAENWFTVLNYFPATQFIEPINLQQGPVKLVWFSQNISAGRGLELILPFVKQATTTVELHLVGNLDACFYDAFLKDISNIQVHAPMHQTALHHELEKFDIGLALEISTDRNRDLCITNKILAYLQAGLFVVATNTAAQQSFLRELPNHGVCFDYKTNNAAIVFENIIKEINTIRSEKNKRYKNFENRNWETASLALLNQWKK